MAKQTDLAERVKEHGFYRHHSFNAFDEELRRRGWYAEDIFRVGDMSIPIALRVIARGLEPINFDGGFILIPACQVLSENKVFINGDYVFYRPIKRLFPDG